MLSILVHGLLPALLLSALGPTPAAAEPSEVNVYSTRQAELIEPLFAEFTKQTGIKVNVMFADKGLIERIEAEGQNSPADLLLTVDVGSLALSGAGFSMAG